MRDLVAINGPWQVITFLNFYMTEYDEKSLPPFTIVFYEINDELKRVCEKILSNYTYADQLLNIEEINSIVKTPFKNLWIGKMFSGESKKIIDSFPELPIILFEEGLHSYVDKERFTLLNVTRKADSVKNKIKTILKFFIKKQKLIKAFPNLILSIHKSRCIKKYYLLPLLNNETSKDIVSSKYVSIILKETQRVFGPNSITFVDRPIVLVIGQYFSSLNLIDPDSELKVYFKILNHYIDIGVDVYWKGHPRSKMFDEKIKECFQEKVKVLENNAIPLEFFLISNPNIELSGISSSVLLYNALLFDGNANQSLYLIKNQLNKKNVWYNDFLKMFSFIENNVQKTNI
tara:strand:+ start:1638 stop:2675 length:1038 start_codon:yes stop_codon:yes gene_type:complete